MGAFRNAGKWFFIVNARVIFQPYTENTPLPIATSLSLHLVNEFWHMWLCEQQTKTTTTTTKINQFFLVRLLCVKGVSILAANYKKKKSPFFPHSISLSLVNFFPPNYCVCWWQLCVCPCVRRIFFANYFSFFQFRSRKFFDRCKSFQNESFVQPVCIMNQSLSFGRLLCLYDK